MVLVSAPAGFGKTSLLTQWLAAVADDGHVAAWLAVDESDNRPGSFWPHLVAAIGAAVPGFGAGVLPLLESGGAPTEGMLASLVNELDALSDELWLVLDDYHLIDDQGIHAGVSYLLEHLPAQAHLLITTRADPPLPLARLRARGDLVEIRAADLRFTPEEASTYLNDVMGLELRPEEIVVLEARTEGWIAALQLAALSMQGRDDVAGFIAGLTGNDRYIVDYLVEEVLARQPEPVRSFLLRTSILEQLNRQLCDAVTADGASKTILEKLDRSNLFVVPLDDRRQWYRYHRLFADVLRAYLEEEHSDQIPDLHHQSEGRARRRDRPREMRGSCVGFPGTPRCFGRGWHRFEAMSPPPSSTRSGPSSWLSTTTTWCGPALPVFSASRCGPVASSERSIGHGASASHGSSGRGTCRTHSGRPSRWATSAWSRGA